MNNPIKIQQPCHQNWDKMLPAQKGKYCASCSKIVMDFSTWETDEIVAYLQQQKAGSVCGRLTEMQLTQPSKWQNQESFLSKIFFAAPSFVQNAAAIILICLGLLQTAQVKAQKKNRPSSCKIPKVLLGTPTVVKTDSSKKEDAVKVAQPPRKNEYPPIIMGKMKVVNMSVKKEK